MCGLVSASMSRTGTAPKQLATEVTQRLPAIAAEAGGVRVVEEGIQVTLLAGLASRA